MPSDTLNATLPAGARYDECSAPAACVEFGGARRVCGHRGRVDGALEVPGVKGRAGEVVTRTRQTAHKMKTQSAPLPRDSERNDNFRAEPYVAKYTINPFGPTRTCIEAFPIICS